MPPFSSPHTAPQGSLLDLNELDLHNFSIANAAVEAVAVKQLGFLAANLACTNLAQDEQRHEVRALIVAPFKMDLDALSALPWLKLFTVLPRQTPYAFEFLCIGLHQRPLARMQEFVKDAKITPHRSPGRGNRSLWRR